MAVSAQLRDLIRDATIGLTDAQVCELTGINFATWRRMVQGHVPSDTMLIKFANGLSLDPEPFLAAAREVRAGMDTDTLLRFALEKSKLNQSGKLKLMQMYRQLLSEQNSGQAA